MSIVVGVSAEESSADAIALAAALAHLMRESVVVAHVQPPTIDYPSIGNVDAEWTAYLHEQAQAIHSRAIELLSSRWGVEDVESVTVPNTAVSRGLLDVADRVGASVIVVGPGAIRGESRVWLGSTAQSLIHGSHVAVALAPEGYRDRAPGRLSRLVVGFRDGDPGVRALHWAAHTARSADIDVELLTAIIRVTRIVNVRLGRDPERLVLQALREQETQAQHMATQGLGTPVHGVVVEGDSADEALDGFDWRGGDLFVLGSSRFGIVSGVLLGDVGKKLLRASPVPALVLPRHE